VVRLRLRQGDGELTVGDAGLAIVSRDRLALSWSEISGAR
jgi:hypothetical protein